MSVYLPAMFGLIIRRNASTEPFVSREVERFRKYFGRDPESDEHLVALSLAMSSHRCRHERWL